MKMTIEIEGSIYNVLRECAPAGISVELLVQRLLTRVVTLLAANPDAAEEIFEQSSKVPEYRDLLERLGRPAEGGENDSLD